MPHSASIPDTPAKLAVVTGSGSGIGRACAQRFAARGLTVICVGRRSEPLRETVGMIEASGGAAVAVPADVSSIGGVKAVLAAVGPAEVQAVVHAAGTDQPSAMADVTRELYEAELAVNLTGPYFITQGLIGRLAVGAGIVFVSSSSAIRGRDGQSVYGASKAALIGLTINLAIELKPHARVNCVALGAVRTAMIERVAQAYADAHPGDEGAHVAADMLRRAADPHEAAVTIEHLALDAVMVTGIVLPMDKGRTAAL